MNKTQRNALFWTPRILTMMFAVFISLFALDVFEEGGSLVQLILGLLIHLIPTYLVVITLLFAWKWEWVGAVIFTALGFGYIIMAWGKQSLSAYLCISGPLFLVGILFLLGWILRDKLKARSQPFES